MMEPKSGPYPPTHAGLGGSPSKSLDDPITAVFLVLFVIGAICHMTILQINLRRHHKKFLISGMLFGFCMARITTMTMRLVWSTHPKSIPIAIAAQIFVAAGVILLFVINLIFVQRILRASFGKTFGWAKWFSLAFKIYYASIVLMLIALITAVVQMFYTLNPNTLRIDTDIQHVGSIYFATAGFLPLPLLALKLFLPKQPLDKFGEGRFKSKIIILSFTSIILTVGAVFRAIIAFYPRPIDNPAWYHSKACFYIFNFTVEIITVYVYVIIRVDKRFIVPNNSRHHGDYSGKNNKVTMLDRVLSEEQTFDIVDESTGIEERAMERARDEEMAIELGKA